MDKKLILQLKAQGQSYAQIAREFGKTRQRIQQLLAPPTIVKKYIIKKYHGQCCKCGINVGESGHLHHKIYKENNFQDIDNLELLCKRCHTIAHRPPPKFFRICSYCNQTFHASDLKSRIRRNVSGLFFCSKHCQGKYIGKTYGWGARKLAAVK